VACLNESFKILKQPTHVPGSFSKRSNRSINQKNLQVIAELLSVDIFYFFKNIGHANFHSLQKEISFFLHYSKRKNVACKLSVDKMIYFHKIHCLV